MQNDILRPYYRGVAVCAGATFLAHRDKTPFHRAGCISIFCEQPLPTHSITKIPAHHSANATSCHVRAVKAGCSALPCLLRTFQQTRDTPLPCHIERTVLDRRGTTTICTHTASITHSTVCRTSSGISAFGACPIAASIRGVDAAWSSQNQTVGPARNTSVPQTPFARSVTFACMVRVCLPQWQCLILKAVLVQPPTLACVLERQGLI